MGMSDWSRREVLRAGLAAGSSLVLPAGALGCFRPHRDAKWHNDVWTRCIDPQRDTTPASLDEVAKAVAAAAKGGYRIRAVGSGHSFSDIALIDGHLLRTNGLNRPIPLDPGTLADAWRRPDAPPLVAVEAGMTVRQINAALDAKGLALQVMGGWDEQTAGGVVSTATHGSGLKFGSSSSFVRSLVLCTGSGRVLQIEPKNGITARFPGGVATPDGLYRPAELVQDDAVFQAAVVSVGSLGVIYSVVIEVEKKYWLHEFRTLTTWEDTQGPDGFLGQLLATGEPPKETDPQSGALGEAPRHYEIWVNPYAGKSGKHSAVVVKRYYRSSPPTTRCAPRGQLWLHIVTAMDIRDPALAAGYINGNLARAGGLIDEGLRAFVGPQEAQHCTDDVSYRIFNAGDVNKLQAYSAEPALDIKDTIPAMSRLMEIAATKVKNKTGVNAGPISVRFVQPSEAFLSPHYGRPTVTFELEALVGVNHMSQTLRDEELALLRDFKARPHWGLDVSVCHCESVMRDLYPRFDDWKAQFLRLNDAGVFNSQFTDRIGVSDGESPPQLQFMGDNCAK
jgi:hypothetical protein